jgi:hypothetical protein
LGKRAKTGALFFRGRELLGDDNFALTFGAFLWTFFGFEIADCCRRLAFAGFFSAGRPRPRFFECFAKTLSLCL